jgi:Transposase
VYKNRDFQPLLVKEAAELGVIEFEHIYSLYYYKIFYRLLLASCLKNLLSPRQIQPNPTLNTSKIAPLKTPQTPNPPPYNSNLFSSPPQNKTRGEIKESTRNRIRSLRKAGWTTYKIIKESGLSASIVKRVVKAESSKRTRKGKQYKPSLLTTRDVSQIIRYITSTYTSRKFSWSDVKKNLQIEASADTIRKTMKRFGFRRCVACPRPFISKPAAKKRLAFACKYRW